MDELALCSWESLLYLLFHYHHMRIGLNISIADDEERDLQNDLVDYSKPRFGDSVL